MTTDAYLRFDYTNVGYVLDGLEDATVRYGLERPITAGDRLRLETPAGRVFAIADVEVVFEGPLRLAHFDMTVAEDRFHPTDGWLDLFDQLREHYPEADLDPDSSVTVIGFELVGVPNRAGLCEAERLLDGAVWRRAGPEVQPTADDLDRAHDLLRGALERGETVDV